MTALEGAFSQHQEAGFGRRSTQAVKRASEMLLLGIVAPSLFIGVIVDAATHSGSAYGLEFRGNLWRPGKLILQGQSPYEPAKLDRLWHAMQHGHVPAELPSVAQAVYPAPTHVLAAPLALLPFQTAMAIFVLLSIVAVIGALLLLGIRDWRCYGATFLSLAVIQGIKLGGITPFLLFMVAALWRYRHSRVGAAVCCGVAIVAKVFLWPYALWLLATGRKASFFRAAIVATVIAALGWAAIGFRGLVQYPHLLTTLAALEDQRGDSLVAGGVVTGLSTTVARLVAVVAGFALLAAMALVAHRGDERTSFVLALAAAFALTPVVWLQYFELAVVPIALYRPRLSLAWAIPLLLWVVPVDGTLHVSAAAVIDHEGVLLLASLLPFVTWHARGWARSTNREWTSSSARGRPSQSRR
jgi:hypothetical protein